jgi:hypothetical protein
MHALLLAALVALAPQAGRDAENQAGRTAFTPPQVEGQWYLVYAEFDGKKMENASGNTVTIRNNVLTCMKDGKQLSWRLDFGPHGRLWATEMAGGQAGQSAQSGQGGRPGQQTQENREGQQRPGGQAGQAGRDRDQAGGQRGHEGTHEGVFIASQEFFGVCLDKNREGRGAQDKRARSGDATRTDTGTRTDTSRVGADTGRTGSHEGKLVLILRKGSAGGANR